MSIAFIVVATVIGVHVLLAPVMAVDLARSHKLGPITNSGEIVSSTWRSVVVWWAVLGGMPVVGEVVWLPIRKLPPTSTTGLSQHPVDS